MNAPYPLCLAIPPPQKILSKVCLRFSIFWKGADLYFLKNLNSTPLGLIYKQIYKKQNIKPLPLGFFWNTFSVVHYIVHTKTNTWKVPFAIYLLQNNYHLGIYMKNHDCKNWFKTAEITSIMKINVKLQISIYLHLGFYIDFRDLILRDTSMALLHSDL